MGRRADEELMWGRRDLRGRGEQEEGGKELWRIKVEDEAIDINMFLELSSQYTMWIVASYK